MLRLMNVFRFALLAGLVAGCTSAPDGGERGACFANNTCNAGLTCLSARCVREDSGTVDGAVRPDGSVDTGLTLDVATLDAPPDNAADQDVTVSPDTIPAPDVTADSGLADTGATCSGTHPLLDAGARYCGPSDCYCPMPGMGGDTCFPRATAAACCAGRTVVCGSAGDAGMCPTGTHPLLDAGARFCAPGQCRCPSQDTCRPMSVATACCPEPVVCN